MALERFTMDTGQGTGVCVQVPASGSFQLQLMSLVVNSWRTSDGDCCVSSTSSTCHAPCRIFFRVCLSHFQANLPRAEHDSDRDLDLTCTFGNLTTPVVNASVSTESSNVTSSVSSPVAFVDVPVQIQFDFTWPVSSQCL